MPRKKTQRTIKKQIDARELKRLLGELAPEALEILQEVMRDPQVDNKLKIDVAKYILNHILDDPAEMGGADNLIKLANILRSDD